jgi:hypothetical protein
MLKISEVYEKQARIVKQRSDGSEYINFEKVYDARDSLLNLEYVVSVHPHTFSSSLDLERITGRFPEGTKFSTFVLDGNSFRASEIIVVGSFDKFCRILEDNTS